MSVATSENLRRLTDFRKGATDGAMAHHSLMGRGHSRPVERARDRARCHNPCLAHEDHERRVADHRTLSSGPRLVALCRHGAAKADEHVYGHACRTPRASVLEKRVCFDDTLRRRLRYWRHHRRADRVLGWMDALRREFLVLFVLAYIFGIAFQYLPIRAMRRISPRVALLEAIKADTLVLTAFEIGLSAWMAFIYFQFAPPARANIAYLLVHDADRHGSRLHRELSDQLVSSSHGREIRHVSPTCFLHVSSFTGSDCIRSGSQPSSEKS
jgi:Domain of unknown function (DUF4396)